MRMRRLYTVFAASAILAAAGLARTASPSDCDSGGITFSSQADVDAANCSTVTGDVVISATAAGNISFNSLLRIKGNLIVQSCGDPSCSQISGISSSNLTAVEGRLQVSAVPSLRSITLPQLRRVDGDVSLVDLPALDQLSLMGIRRVGSFHLVTAPKLRHAKIGQWSSSGTNMDMGLKNITGNLTGAAEAVVEVRDVALEELDGLLDFWDARRLVIEKLPNLQVQMIKVRNVDEVHVVGNGNLTLRFWEANLVDSGTPGPDIGRLVISGVRSVSPCLQPVVREFVAFDNPDMEYLHFNFDRLRRIEVRGNPRLKKLVSWARLNRFWRDVYIHDNPNLALRQFPGREPGDTVVATYCADMNKGFRDQWSWFPNTFNNVVIAADIDNTFFNATFTSLYLNSSDPGRTKPKVLDRFEVNSTNATFDCSGLNILRSQKGAFPGAYSCQGQDPPAGMGVHGLEGPMRMVLGAAAMAVLVLC